jgi:hypothetical protein
MSYIFKGIYSNRTAKQQSDKSCDMIMGDHTETWQTSPLYICADRLYDASLKWMIIRYAKQMRARQCFSGANEQWWRMENFVKSYSLQLIRNVIN